MKIVRISAAERSNMVTAKLTNENIERTIGDLQSYFEKNGADRSYILRMRLAVEEMLLTYRDRFGEETDFSVVTGGLFGSRRFEIRIICAEYDPAGENEEQSILRNIMTRSELAPHWSYQHQYNRIVCACNRKMTISGNMWLLIAVIAAIALGLIAKSRPAGVIGEVCTTLISPVSTTIMRLMSFFASFMIFWSIITGICSMGDISTFNLVGKKIIRRYLGTLLIVTVGTAAFFLLRTPLTGENARTFEFGPIVTMILDIVPNDPFSPFITGNMLQLVFVAFVLGIVLLILKSRLSQTLFNGIQDLSEVSNMILGAVVTLMPVVVFSSLFQMVANNDLPTILGALEYPAVVLGVTGAVLIIRFVMVCVTRKVSPGTLLKKLWPVMQITLSTSSSSAAYLQTVETCEKKLGIDPRLVKIGVPLGPTLLVVCKPLLLMSVVFVGISWYHLPLTIPTVISIALSSFLLGIAAPPIPGGMTGIYLILFASFGLPEEMMAIVLAFDAVVDHFCTTVNQAMLMLELTQAGTSLDMIDETVLRQSAKQTESNC